MSEKHYDYIIIGGGIAGLYARYLLRDKSVLLLEKEDYLGGRGLEINFHNEHIKLGAGIAALHNKHLLKLLRKLNIKYFKVKGNVNIAFETDFNINSAINLIITKYNQIKHTNPTDINKLTVKEFIEKYFGKDFFKSYAELAEYTDFFNSDINYYINYYPILDHKISKYNIVYVSWTELIDKLKRSGSGKIKLNYEVLNIKKLDSNDKYNNKVNYLINNEFLTENIICTLTANPLKSIIQKNNLFDITPYKYIDSIEFVRIYTYHKNGHNLKKLKTVDGIPIDRYNIVRNHLQKIIIMSDKILMISYSDNLHAKYWKKYIRNKDELKRKIIAELRKMFSKSDLENFVIDDIYIKYWKEGVHYYKPHPKIKFKNLIKKLSNPTDNIYVGGEMVSLKQGWVEGSIESIDRIYSRYL